MATNEKQRYILVEGTPEQELACIERECVFWGRGLSLEAFREAKAQANSTPFSVRKRRRWVLVPEHDPTTTDFPAACGTYERAVLCRLPGSDSITEHVSLSVAGVLVDPEKRGSGLGSIMMTELAKRIQAEGATMSFLYSDVGDYYSRFGWKLGHSREHEWAAGDIPDRLPEGVTTEPLRREDLADAAEWDETASRQKLMNGGSSTKLRFAILDREGLGMDWLITRSIHATKTAIDYEQEICGGKVTGSATSFVTWCIVPAISPQTKPQTLLILRIHVKDLSELHALLHAAKVEANKAGLANLQCWDLDVQALGFKGDSASMSAWLKANACGAKEKVRPDHLPAYALFGSLSGMEAEGEQAIAAKACWN